MKICEKVIATDKDLIRWLPAPPEDCLFFDIETTGLSWRRSHLYLLGVVYLEEENWILKQWFCDRPSEEGEVLAAFASLLASRRALIHYNGTTFDVPYVAHKFPMYGLDFDWTKPAQTDIYRQMAPYRKMLGLSHLRQKDLESAMDLPRADAYDGGELIEVYRAYLLGGGDNLLQALWLHNREDVENLFRLTGALAIPALFESAAPIRYRGETWEDGVLIIRGVPCHRVPCALSWENGLAKIDIAKDGARIEVPVRDGEWKLFYPDYKNYVYLPEEDTAIHKSVGIFVDKEYRRRATADTAYTRTTGSCLPQPVEIFHPALRKDRRDAVSYVPLDAWRAAPDSLKETYLARLLAVRTKNAGK